MIGQTISHYRITEKLGEGGMGVVYKAEDTKLERPVALKFLAAHAIEDPESKARFVREAKAAARLDHQNICPIHEIDETAGQTFLAMAYLEGHTVKEKIAERPLKLDQALDIAVQTAQGLQAAHEKHIVHRDIKSANLMLTPRGQVKIMDFGLAQLAERSKLTETTTILGTPSYMSPEQAVGKKTDRRTDLWSMGVVLYEMVTGRLPFEGERQEAVLYGISNEEPEPVTALRAGLPMELEWIIGKALAKDRQERYQHAEDVLVDLRSLQRKLQSGPELRPASRASRTKETGPSIVVLPFQNRGRDEEDEYFADGVTEDVISTLGKLEGLRVIPRGSAFQFKGKRPALHELVQSLRVSHVLEGSVRHAGDRLRITVELIEAADGDQVWTERYDRVMADIFDIQDEISQAIAQALKAKLTSATPSPAGVRRTTNLDAYRLYLKGRQHFYAFSESGVRQAISCFEKALAHDPLYPEPHSGLADAYSVSGIGFARPREVMPKAKAEALRALELDETIGEAHASLAVVQFSYDWDFAGAEQSFRRAIELDPAVPTSRTHFGYFLGLCGRSGEGVAQCRAAVDLDPLNPFVNRLLALALLFAGDYEAVLEYVRKTLEIEPSHFPARWEEAHAHYMLGRPDEALLAMEAAQTLAPQDVVTLALLGAYQAAAGRAEDALRTVQQLKAIRSQRHVGAFLISQPYLLTGRYGPCVRVAGNGSRRTGRVAGDHQASPTIGGVCQRPALPRRSAANRNPGVTLSSGESAFRARWNEPSEGLRPQTDKFFSTCWRRSRDEPHGRPLTLRAASVSLR